MQSAAKLTADPSVIRAFLAEITAGWDEVGEPVVIELRCLFPDRKPHTAHFQPTPEGMAELADHAAAMNATGLNCYVVINPVRASIGARDATDADIPCAYLCWADGDDEAAARNIKAFDGPQYTFAVMTGRVPHARPHVYWRIEDAPVRNLAAWSEVQRGIAGRLGTDRVVVNPSRIMRLPGTVNWPTEKKAGKGRVAELATFRTQYDDDREPVPFETLRAAFAAYAQTNVVAMPGASFEVDTGILPTLDRERARIKALSGEEWHHSVIRLVASYVSRGLGDDEIHALTGPLTLPGYTVDQTRREVQTAIDGARRKGWTPEPGAQSAQAIINPNAKLTILTSYEFAGNPQPPVYVIDGLLQRGFTHSLTGYTGHGKTTAAIHLMLCVATGRDYCGREVEQGSTLFIAGENPDNVRFQYAAAVAAAGLNPADLPCYFLPGHFQMSAMEAELHRLISEIPNLKLIIIDSLQSFFEGESDNSNVEMIQAAQRFRRLSELPAHPSNIVIAHPAGKKPDRSNLLPRGGSAFTNELDGNFTLWAEPDGSQVLHFDGKHRGPPFDPISLVMVDCEFDHLTDHKGRRLRLKYTREQLVIEQANAAAQNKRRVIDILAIIDADPEVSQRAIAERLRISKSTADRAFQELKDEKLIRRHARKWVLTDGGKEVLERG